jgi:hypothetical protein
MLGRRQNLRDANAGAVIAWTCDVQRSATNQWREVRLQAVSDTPDAFGSTHEREVARTAAHWQRWFSPGVTFILDDAEGHKGIVARVHDAIDLAIVHLMSMWVHLALRRSDNMLLFPALSRTSLDFQSAPR